MKRLQTSTSLSRAAVLLMLLALGACQPAAHTADNPGHTPLATSRPNGQATALIPATLAPTPTQFQPELTSQAVTQAAGQAPLGIKQWVGSLAIVPSHYEWSQQSAAADGVVQFSILVALENTSTEEAVKFDPAQFSLLDSAGKPLPVSSAGTGAERLTAQTLNPGDKVQGNLVFDVPESQQTETGWNIKLVFAGGAGQSPSWSLAG